MTLRLKPGEFVSEYALADSLRIGRTPIREALQQLAREGLVTILPRKGILVSETDPRKQLLVLEVRRELERLLCRLGAQRATEEQRAGSARSPTAWTAPPRATTTSPSCASTASSTCSSRMLRTMTTHHAPCASCTGIRDGSGTCTTGRRPICRCARGCMRRRPAPLRRAMSKRASDASDRLIDYTETFTRATVAPEPRPARARAAGA